MNTVLFQEATNYNNLLKIVNESIVNLKKAIKGMIIMNPIIEEVYKSILSNKVPKLWSNTFLSLKPLFNWVDDL